ncbi:SGNH/GDSL hydrolase family protein [Saccharomonospora azurea]|uniref:SGNH/GDSL hydrolase family protein n=1 Tax=Saccharomonospora azurea TaxID=40988 RepID=UPI0002400614|nr:SGNH/GDSL hydrolase family protein [Saccharomonospora azurea]EHK85625.1 lipolytic protein G-D-S-L family [Saccharomonospora azurea SZMC 14600]
MTGAPTAPAHPDAVAVLRTAQPLVWSFVGDSVTAASWHTWGGRGLSELVQERLRETGRRRDGVVNTAVSGWRVHDLHDQLDVVCLRYHPDVVVIGTGLNDTRGGADGVGEFGRTYRDVVVRLREQTGALVVTQTPNGTLPTAPSHVVEHLDAYVAEIRAVSAELGTVLVDHDAVWQATEVDVTYHWLGHGCHPNAFGHRALARTFLQTFGLWDPDASRTCRLTIP